jgi:PAS domain S-box-containing protein
MNEKTKYTLLLADDNPQSLKLLDAVCTAEGYSTKCTRDGKEAMEVLLKERIDLIVTDILMPNVDGYFLCYKVRSHERLRDIPIIVYTATYTTTNEESIAREMGADIFIRKPSPSALMLAAIEELLTNPARQSHTIAISSKSFEVMHQYNSQLIDKLEQRNIALEEIKRRLEATVEERTRELKNINEELLASNEELVSNNEELAAMNEQLQSAAETIRTQADIIIQQKDEQLNLVLESSNDIVWSLDMTGAGNSYISRSAQRITGRPLSDIANNPGFWMDFIIDEDRPIRDEALHQLEHQNFVECTYRIIDQYSTTHWLNEKIRLISDDAGKPVRREGIAFNISSLKDAELKLQAAHDRLLFHIDNSPLGFIEWNDRLRVTSLSKRAEEIFGWSEKEFISLEKDGLSQVHPDDKAKASEAFSELLEGKVQRNILQHRNITKDGKVIWCEWYNSILKNKGGKVVTLMSLVHEITARKENEARIEESEKRYRTTLDGMMEGCQIIDRDWRYVYINPTAARQGQYSPERLTGRTMMEVYPGIENTELFGVLRTCMATRSSKQMDNEFLLPDGTTGCFELRIQPAPEGLFILSIDISERRRAEVAKINSELRFREFFETVPQGITILDAQTARFSSCNTSAVNLFGCSREELLTKTPADVSPPFQPDGAISVEKATQFIFAAAKGEKPVFEWVVRDASGRDFMCEVRLIKLPGADNDILASFMDITEVVRYRQGLEKMVEERTAKLNEALQKEKELVIMKNKFISIASHEFRTPLSSISLAAGFIKKYKKKLTEAQINQKLENIEKQVNNMTYLLDDVLIVGKAEAGRMQANLAEITIDIFEKLAKEVITARKGKHKIKYIREGDKDTFISDEKFLRNIIINLVSNAVKFSANGSEVILKVATDDTTLSVTVKDKGIGIPPEDIKNLFTSFSRGSNVAAIEGTGLGLSIAKKAVDVLNGKITVTSQVGAGTEFTVTLPITHG